MNRLAAAFMLVIASSCGGPRDGDEPVDMTPQAVCSFLAERDCNAWKRCNAAEVELSYGTIDLCRERLAVSCVNRLTAPGTNETPAGIVECAKALTDLSCATFLETDRWPKVCEIPRGRLPDGATCFRASQCQGSFCAFAGLCGTCKTAPRQGESCTTESECADFLPCVDGMCAPHPTLGEPCDNAKRSCAGGYICRNVDPTSMLGTCAVPSSAGAACEGEAFECNTRQGLWCNESKKICEPYPLRNVGETCEEFNDPNSGICDNSSLCDADHVCKLKAREGQACDPNVVGNPCLSPARCLNGFCKIRDATLCP